MTKLDSKSSLSISEEKKEKITSFFTLEKERILYFRNKTEISSEVTFWVISSLYNQTIC